MKEGDNIVAQVWVSMKGNNKSNDNDPDIDRMLSKSLKGHMLTWKIRGQKSYLHPAPFLKIKDHYFCHPFD